MTTIAQVVEVAARRLETAGIPDARPEAEFLVAALLKRSRTRLFLDRDEMVRSPSLQKITTGIAKRARRWPLAYITQDQPFRDLILKITPDVLIPRPETEELVEHVLERLASDGRPVSVADIGTGSGCIAVSLARSPWVTRVVGTDLSAKALRVAAANARAYDVSKRCAWLRGDLLAPLLKTKQRVHGIVANLPYVAAHELTTLEPELFREPRRALDGGVDGLDLIYTLIAQAPSALRSKGWLMLEIGIRQDRPVQNLLQVSGLWTHIRMYRDLSRKPRFIAAQLKG